MTNEQLTALRAFINALLTEHEKLIKEFIPAKAQALSGQDHAQKHADQLQKRISVLEKIKSDFEQADTFEKLQAAAKKAQQSLAERE